MVNFSTPPGLEGLFDLDRKGVDIRPTLLRVLTDQYLQSPVHSADEERHYTELAMRLIDETDIPTRAAVATRLAPHACAPRSIILQLARDVLEVAEPVLLYSPCLTPADCEAIIQERGVIYAGILERRGKAAAIIQPEPLRRPAAGSVTKTAAPLTPPAGTPVIPASTPSPDENQQTGSDPDARELCELFFAAGSVERRLILINLDYAEWPAGEPPATMQRSDIWRMETAALRHNTSTVMRELERALRISYRLSRRIVDDEQGEPIVAAAKAMSLPTDVLQRIVLFINPKVGQSVDRVYELSRLYGEISVEAARRLIAILRAAEPAERPKQEAHAFARAERSAPAEAPARKQAGGPALRRTAYEG